MTAVRNSFFSEVKSFANEHKVLCVLTLGLAVVGYAVGNLIGRTVSWIKEGRGTTGKADAVASSSLHHKSQPEQKALLAGSPESSTPLKSATKVTTPVDLPPKEPKIQEIAIPTISKFDKQPVTSRSEASSVDQATTSVVRPTIPEDTAAKSSGVTKPSSEKLPIPSKIEAFVNALKKERGVEIRGGQDDTWHEIVFDGAPYEKSNVHCPWKLHISPGTDTMAVLDAVKPVLLKRRPYCKIVPNQQKLKNLEKSLDLNNKKVFKGKCLTIYPKTEKEALMLAKELHEAIAASNLINQNKEQQPCTDRPLGASGYLWSRHDLAGGPIDEISLQDSDHAHAMVGNYDTTVVLPMTAFDFETTPSGRKAYDAWYTREFPNFERIVHPDIFKETFGSVHWTGDSQSDQGRFETT
jgi:hypothetical protein